MNGAVIFLFGLAVGVVAAFLWMKKERQGVTRKVDMANAHRLREVSAAKAALTQSTEEQTALRREIDRLVTELTLTKDEVVKTREEGEKAAAESARVAVALERENTRETLAAQKTALDKREEDVAARAVLVAKREEVVLRIESDLDRRERALHTEEVRLESQRAALGKMC